MGMRQIAASRARSRDIAVGGSGARTYPRLRAIKSMRLLADYIKDAPEVTANEMVRVEELLRTPYYRAVEEKVVSDCGKELRIIHPN